MEKKFILDTWKEKLDKFLTNAQNAKAEKETLEKIHQCMREMQQIKDDIYNHISSGCYLHDDRRIVISAPEIVIGNVDKDGILKGASKVIIRSNNINVEGVGRSGTVAIRANSIRNKTEDPGIDGTETVVYDNASFSCLSRSITLDSTLALPYGVFYRDEEVSTTEGISLRSDTSISINAALSISDEGMKKALEKRKTDIKITDIASNATTQQNNTKDIIEKIKNTINKKEKWETSDELSNANVAAIETLIGLLENDSPALMKQIKDYIQAIVELAEAKRKVNALDTIISNLKAADHYKDNSTGCSLSLNGESIVFSTKDGDSKPRENKTAGMTFDQIKSINILAKDSTGAIMKDSHVNIETQDVSIITNASKREDEKKPLHYDTAEGSVRVNSKNITVTAYDYDAPEKDTDSPYKMKQLAAEGKITIGANSIDINSADQEGKAAGTVDINSKSIVLQSVNKPKDDGNGGGGNDKVELAEEGATKIFSKNINIGGEKLKDESKAEKIILTAKKYFSQGDEEAALLQGTEKDNSILLKDKKLNAKNSGAQIFESDKHDFSGDVNISKEAKIKTGNVDTLKATASFNAPQSLSASGGTPLSVNTDKAEVPELE